MPDNNTPVIDSLRLTRDRNKTLSTVNGKADADLMFAVNDLKVLVDELSSLSTTDLAVKTGLTRNDVQKLKERQKRNQDFALRQHPSNFAYGFLYPSKSSAQRARQQKKAELEVELAPRRAQQLAVENRGFGGDVLAALSGAARGFTADATARRLQESGKDPMLAYQGMEMEDPVFSGGAQFGYGFGSTVGPSLASIPGNIYGAGLLSNLAGMGANALGVGRVGVGLARGLGALAGGYGGAMATGYIGQKFMPSAGLDPSVLGRAQETMGGPAQTLGQMAGLFSVYSPFQQTPKGRLSAFEGAGMRGFVGKAMRSGLGEAIADPESVGAPIDLASRAAEVTRGILERPKTNENARLAFQTVYGRAPQSEAELIPFGYITNEQALSDIASNTLLSGITRGGKFLGGVGNIQEGPQAQQTALSSPQVAAGASPTGAPSTGVSVATAPAALPNPGTALTFQTSVSRAGGNVPHTVSFNISGATPVSATVTKSLGWGTSQLRSAFNGQLSSGKITFADSEGQKSIRGIDSNGNFIVEVTPQSGMPRMQIVGLGKLPSEVVTKLQDTASRAGQKNAKGRVEFLDLNSLTGQQGTYSTNYDVSQFPDSNIYDHNIIVNGQAVKVNVQSISGDRADVELPSGIRMNVPLAGIKPVNTSQTDVRVSPRIQPADAFGLVGADNKDVFVKSGNSSFFISPSRQAEYNNAADENGRMQAFRAGYIDASSPYDDKSAGALVGSIVNLGSLYRPSKSGRSKAGTTNHYGVVTDVSAIDLNGQRAYVAQVQSITNPSLKPFYAPLSVVKAPKPTAPTATTPAATTPTAKTPAATTPAQTVQTGPYAGKTVSELINELHNVDMQLAQQDTPEGNIKFKEISEELKKLGIGGKPLADKLDAMAKAAAATTPTAKTPSTTPPATTPPAVKGDPNDVPLPSLDGLDMAGLIKEWIRAWQIIDDDLFGDYPLLEAEIKEIEKRFPPEITQELSRILSEFKGGTPGLFEQWKQFLEGKLKEYSKNAGTPPAVTPPTTPTTPSTPTTTAATGTPSNAGTGQVTPSIDVTTMSYTALHKLKERIENLKRPTAQHLANLQAVNDQLDSIEKQAEEDKKTSAQNIKRNFEDPVSEMSDERLENLLQFFQNKVMLNVAFGGDPTQSLDRYKEIEAEIARRAAGKGSAGQQGTAAPTAPAAATATAVTQTTQPTPQKPKPLLPEDYEHPYGEEFKDIATDESIPERMRSDQRGGEDYAYRRQTAGEEFTQAGKGNLTAVPKQMWQGFKRFVGFFTFKGKDIGLDLHDMQFDVDLGEGISNREDFKARLINVYGQTDQQAEALSQWVDRWAMGWAREMMRISGVRTMDTYRAARIESDPKVTWPQDANGNLIIPKDQEWKQFFFEQQAPRTDKDHIEMTQKLMRYFYGNRLGNITALAKPIEVSKDQFIPGFTQGFYSEDGHNRTVMNIAFALQGSENFAVQVHEVNHLLVRALYGPMYHQLVSQMLFMQADKLGTDIIGIDPSAEERIVTALTLSLLKGTKSVPFGENYSMGGSDHDPFLGKLFGDLGGLLHEAASQSKDPFQQIHKKQGWGIYISDDDRNAIFGQGAVIPAGTTLIVEDSNGINQYFVVSDRFINQSGNINAIYGHFEGQDTSKPASSITTSQVVGFGEGVATIGNPQQGEHLSGNAQKLIAKWLGHWSDFQTGLFETVNVEAPAPETFTPVGAIALARGTVGYQWWQNTDDYRARIQKDEIEFNDPRVYGRFRYTHFGWLDQNQSGYEAYRSFEDIEKWEWENANKRLFQSDKGVDPVAPKAVENAAAQPAEPQFKRRGRSGSSFMSTEGSDKKELELPQNALPEDVVKAFLGEDAEDKKREATLTASTVELLATGVQRYILDRGTNRNDQLLIQRIMALPLTGMAVRRKYRDQFANMQEALMVRVGWPYYSNFTDPVEITKRIFSANKELDSKIESGLMSAFSQGFIKQPEISIASTRLSDRKEVSERRYVGGDAGISIVRMPSGEISQTMQNVFWNNIHNEISHVLANISVETVNGQKALSMWITTPNGYSVKRYVTPEFAGKQLQLAVSRGAQKGAIQYRTETYGAPKPPSPTTVIDQIASAQNKDQAYLEYAKSNASNSADRILVDDNDFLRRLRIRFAVNGWSRKKSDKFVSVDALTNAHVEPGKAGLLEGVKVKLNEYVTQSNGDIDKLTRLIISDHSLRIVHAIHHTAGNGSESLIRLNNGKLEIADINNSFVENRQTKNNAIRQLDEYIQAQAMSAITMSVSIDEQFAVGNEPIAASDTALTVIEKVLLGKPVDEIELVERTRSIREALSNISSSDLVNGIEADYEFTAIPSIVDSVMRKFQNGDYPALSYEVVNQVSQGATDIDSLLLNINEEQRQLVEYKTSIEAIIKKGNNDIDSLTEDEKDVYDNVSDEMLFVNSQSQDLSKLYEFIKDSRVDIKKQAAIAAKNANAILSGMVGSFDRVQTGDQFIVKRQLEIIDLIDAIRSEVVLGAENFASWATDAYTGKIDNYLLDEAVASLIDQGITEPSKANVEELNLFFKKHYDAFSIASRMLVTSREMNITSEKMNPVFAELTPSLTLREMAAGMLRLVARSRGENVPAAVEKLIGEVSKAERDAFTHKSNKLENQKLYQGLDPQSSQSRALDFIRNAVFASDGKDFNITPLGKALGLKDASVAELMYEVLDVIKSKPDDPRRKAIARNEQAQKQFAALPVQIRSVFGRVDENAIFDIVNRIGSACVITPANFRKASWNGERLVTVDKNVGNVDQWPDLIKPAAVKNAVIQGKSYNQIIGQINKPVTDAINELRESTTSSDKQRNIRMKYLLERKRLVLSDAEIASLVNLHNGLSSVQKAARFRELVDQRDENIRSQIKAVLEKESSVKEASTIADYNKAMDDLNMTRQERLACMGALLRAFSRNHLNKIHDFAVANGRLPSAQDLAGMADTNVTVDKLKSDLAKAESVVREFGLDALVNGTVGTRIRVSEIATSQLQSDVTGIGFAIDSDVKAASMAMVDGMAARSIQTQASLLTDERLHQAFIDVDVANELTMTQQAELLKGTKLSDLIFVDKVKSAGRTETPGKARSAKSVPAYPGKNLAGRIVKATQNALIGIFDGIAAGDNFDIFSKNTILAGTKVESLVAMIPTLRSADVEGADKTLSDNQRQIRVALAKIVDAFADTVVKANVRIIESLNDVSLDELDFVLNSSDSRVVDAVRDGRVVYQIDYVNARVKEFSANGSEQRYITGDGAGQWTDLGLNPVPPLNRAETALVNFIMDGMPADVSMEERVQIMARVNEAVHSYDGMRTVPAVYWTGRTRVHNTSVNTSEPLFHARSIMDNATVVAEKFGVLSPEDVDAVVLPVLKGWETPDKNNVVRLVKDSTGQPYFDGEGYTVYDRNGNRSQIFARLMGTGLSTSKALEIYAMTDGPVFSQFADDAGGLVEAVMMSNPGMMVHQAGRIPLKGAEFLVKQQGMRIDLRHALTRYEQNPTQDNLDTLVFHYDNMYPDEQAKLDKTIARLKDPSTRNIEIATIRQLTDVVTNLPKTANSFVKTYDAYKKAEIQISTGKPFTTLGFITDHGWNAEGRQGFDLGTGLYDNEQRTNKPYWVRFKNPLVVDIEGGSISNEHIAQAQKDLKEADEAGKSYDGVVFLNVNDSMRSATSRNIAFSTDFTNVMRPHDMLVGPAKATETKRMLRASVSPMFMSTMPAPPTGSPAPVPSVQGAVATRDITATEWIGKTGSRMLDEAQTFARFALSLDWAFTTIQGGKALLGFVVDPFNFFGKRNETLIAFKAFLGSLNGMKPNMQITLPGGKKLGPDKMGRRAWVNTYLNLRQDPLWNVMREMNVPLHMLNFEKRVEAERQRRYELANGTLNYEDIAVNMLDFDERGNMTEFFEENTLLGRLPLVGMFERQMSLQHDLLLFGLIKNQLATNPHMRNIMSQPDGMEKIVNDRVARTMINFIATSMGDFQYSSNERVDAIAGRVGKAVLAAPRWYFSNLTINPFINAAASIAYNNIPAVKKFFGPNLRGANLYAHKDIALYKYQFGTTLWTMAWLGLIQGIIEVLGRYLHRPDITGDPYKVGAFRIGNWRVAESTGMWDAWNYTTQLARSFLKGEYEVLPKPGMTLDETNMGFISNTASRLGYKASPLLTRGLSLITGRDVIGRAIYKPDVEMQQGIEDMYAQVAPVLRMAGITVPTTVNGEDIPFTSVMVSGALPASWQEAWQSYGISKFHNMGNKSVARDIALNQFFASFMGTQIKYDKYVPKFAQGLHRSQQLFRRAKMQSGPTGFEAASGGFKDYWNYAVFGKK